MLSEGRHLVHVT